MSTYEYIIYAEDGSFSRNNRDGPFTLEELRTIVGGRIEILPAKIPGIKGYKNVYVVCEDGIYKYGPNKNLPQFYGPVLLADKKLIN